MVVAAARGEKGCALIVTEPCPRQLGLMSAKFGMVHTGHVLVTPHLSLGGTPRMAPRTPDVSLLDDTVAPRILDAMRVASARLTELGVRHVLVGGLAVGAWGHARATKDVDFLVGEEAFEHHPGALVTMKYGVPIQVGGVAVDLLSASANNREDALLDPRSSRVPVAPLPC